MLSLSQQQRPAAEADNSEESGRPRVDYEQFLALGELIHCAYVDYPNVRRWIGNMKALRH